jgi:hypothetical protein
VVNDQKTVSSILWWLVVVSTLDVGGRGDVVTRTCGGWVGWGFGLEGMVKGAVDAAIMNALTTRTHHRIEAIVKSPGPTGSWHC